jgi:hypothetical protein
MAGGTSSCPTGIGVDSIGALCTGAQITTPKAAARAFGLKGMVNLQVRETASRRCRQGAPSVAAALPPRGPSQPTAGEGVARSGNLGRVMGQPNFQADLRVCIGRSRSAAGGAVPFCCFGFILSIPPFV